MEEKKANTQSRRMPRCGSLEKLCTEVRTPERTKKVPRRLKQKVTIASRAHHGAKRFRFFSAARECRRAVPESHGKSAAFSTGSQNHQPPQPSSRYAHRLPSPIPSVRADHEMRVHGCTMRAHEESIFPSSRAREGQTPDRRKNPHIPHTKSEGVIAKPMS